MVPFLFIGALAAYGSQVYNSDFPMRAYGVNCTGNEKNIFSCPIHLTSKGDEYENCKTGVSGVFCQGIFQQNELYQKAF